MYLKSGAFIFDIYIFKRKTDPKIIRRQDGIPPPIFFLIIADTWNCDIIRHVNI